MKKLAVVLCFLALTAVLLSSCGESKLYGTWYNDTDGIRNVIQFSENNADKNVFVWAIYDIENDSVESNTSGYFYVDGSTLTLQYQDKSSSIELTFKLDGNELTLSGETAALKLEKYTLDN